MIFILNNVTRLVEPQTAYRELHYSIHLVIPYIRTRWLSVEHCTHFCRLTELRVNQFDISIFYQNAVRLEMHPPCP